MIKINDFMEIMKGCCFICNYDLIVKISKEEMIEILEEVIIVLFFVNVQLWCFFVIDSLEGKEKFVLFVSFN